jgi:hypothetical protein
MRLPGVKHFPDGQAPGPLAPNGDVYQRRKKGPALPKTN